MIYLFDCLEDCTVVTSSNRIQSGDRECVETHFERPVYNGFDSARYVLPDRRWLFIEGYSADEIHYFEEYIKQNEAALCLGIFPVSKENSDIHGNMRRFNSVIQQIDLQPEDTLYVLGDVIDRHPDGIRILRKLMAMPNVKMLLGNHEYMMLRAIGRPFDTYEQMDDLLTADATKLWYCNGGKVTHSYWKHIRKDMREEIIQYLHSLNLNYDIEVNGVHYKLVHGAPTEEYENFHRFYPNPTHFSVWKRWRIFEEQHGEYILIFGHTPTLDYQNCTPMKIWNGVNRIGIDC